MTILIIHTIHNLKRTKYLAIRMLIKKQPKWSSFFGEKSMCDT